MALVKKLERMTKERNSVYAPVVCAYTVFSGSDGRRYLQLDTFGSRNRQIVGKVSQSIHPVWPGCRFRTQARNRGGTSLISYFDVRQELVMPADPNEMLD